jgi:hypothetical protein
LGCLCVCNVTKMFEAMTYNAFMEAYIHTHTHIHTYIHTNTHTHTYIHTCTHTYTRAYRTTTISWPRNSRVCTPIIWLNGTTDTYTHTYIHTHIQNYDDIIAEKFKAVHADNLGQRNNQHIHTYNTYIHTYIHTYRTTRTS